MRKIETKVVHQFGDAALSYQTQSTLSQLTLKKASLASVMFSVHDSTITKTLAQNRIHERIALSEILLTTRLDSPMPITPCPTPRLGT